MKKFRVLKVLFLAAAFFLGGAPPAHAYLDPGSGSLIFQVVIGGIAAFFFAIKTYWLKIKSFFDRGKK